VNRIDTKFQELKKARRKGLVGYLTAGDPDPEVSLRNIRDAVKNGLDFLEIGVPFSDPTADGPVIQEASCRALAAGMNIPKVLEMVKNLRQDEDLPVVLFGYANPFFHYGYEKLCRDAAEAGVDGLLIVDLPFEEMGEIQSFMKANGLYIIPLIAPTTPVERARTILRDARGFVYYIMVTGITGVRTNMAEGVSAHIQELRACTDLPIAAGFGVGNGEQARMAAEKADAVVVGSALVKASGEGRLGALVRELRTALDG